MVVGDNGGEVRLRIDKQWDGAPLKPHEVVEIEVVWGDDSLRLTVKAPFYQDPKPPQSIGSTPGLWEHEVVEWFLVGDGEPVPYLEVEMGPHGHYLVLQLLGVRNIVHTALATDYQSRVTGDRWFAEMVLPNALLPPSPHRQNAFSIHGVGEARRYSAAFAVPGHAPDFHRLDCFRRVP
jgi:hypothetical protein